MQGALTFFSVPSNAAAGLAAGPGEGHFIFKRIRPDPKGPSQPSFASSMAMREATRALL